MITNLPRKMFEMFWIFRNLNVQRPQANHFFAFIDFVRFMLRRCQVGFNGIFGHLTVQNRHFDKKFVVQLPKSHWQCVAHKQ